MRTRSLLLACAAITSASHHVCAQTTAVDEYLRNAGVSTFFSNSELVKRSQMTEEQRHIQVAAILPNSKTKAFLIYANTKSHTLATKVAADAVSAQFNKLLGSSVGTAGTTSVTSGSAVSSILSLAMEYGAVTQSNSGNVATIRTNLFNLIQPLVGGEVFPPCTDSSKSTPCTPASRWLRKLSASYSAETSGTGSAMATGTNAQTGAANATNIIGGGYRTAGWSVRMDWLAANPYHVAADKFKDAIKGVGDAPEFAAFETATTAILNKQAVQDLYFAWSARTVADLNGANDETEAKRRLEADLDELIVKVQSADGTFGTNLLNLQTAYLHYYDLLDQTIQKLQTNKLSTEFTAQHPLGQANTSNLRVIYSWQPTKTPLLFTFNGAVTWYDSIPKDVTAGKIGRLRDAQLSAQLDRKIGKLGAIPNSVFTIAGYYQWQLENALITIDSGNTVPGTGIMLPDKAATLLAPKGNIAIAQLKWTLPIKNGVVKIPFSFTWANRTELINEQEKRGQVGVTLDLDSVFAKGSQ